MMMNLYELRLQPSELDLIIRNPIILAYIVSFPELTSVIYITALFFVNIVIEKRYIGYTGKPKIRPIPIPTQKAPAAKTQDGTLR